MALIPKTQLSCSDAAHKLLRTSSLADDVRSLRYVSGARAEALARRGITRARDLLYHFPARYLDFSKTVSIAYADLGQTVTVVGTVDKVKVKHPKPRLSLVEVYVLDQTGVIEAVFFKQPWIANQIHEGDTLALSGKVDFAYGFKQLKTPFFEVLFSAEDVQAAAPLKSVCAQAATQPHVSAQPQSALQAQASYKGKILPVHPATEGVSAAWMRRIVSAALTDRGSVCDFVPAALISRHELMCLQTAIWQRHFPSSLATAEQARRRLAYNELLCLQLALLGRQELSYQGKKPTAHNVSGPRRTALLDALPFTLSAEQAQAAAEIAADMAAPRPMTRLLLGDVGTGKTAVAATAIASVADSNTQAAMMAPTSVLAAQYATKLGPVLEAAGISWALLLGSTPARERQDIYARLRTGELCCVFGTTALLSDAVQFKNLTLVVIDEQHRFGVDQRAALRAKGQAPDLLAMTATPIPRTLALSLYGDMELSRIAHRPVAGAGVSTKTLTPENVDLAWGAIQEAIDAGQQAYVVCPLIDDTDSSARDMPGDTLEAPDGSKRRLNSAQATFEQLKGRIFKHARVGLLTGRMPADEKDQVMAAFRAHELDILVSTTVIEVGVDVPNATVMLVRDADRFGLATLHQLRGRVGRGKLSGRVFMEAFAKKGSVARQRLSALEHTDDGFELAELDLKLRQEGEVLGYRQHGGVSLELTNLEQDQDLIAWAHDDARAILTRDPTLSGRATHTLALEVHDRFATYFMEVDAT